MYCKFLKVKLIHMRFLKQCHLNFVEISSLNVKKQCFRCLGVLRIYSFYLS